MNMTGAEIFDGHYESPAIEIIEITLEGGVLAGSTGESFEDDGSYGGDWN